MLRLGDAEWDDPDGKQAPLGCHMRRMTPRDTEMAVLTDIIIHRIIRRSTAFGAPCDSTRSRSTTMKSRGHLFLVH
jgi:deferrochelatase/peroxidase EfeB